jgi:HAE1 family hydrophobic/amphiphilic exporter-1
VVTVFLFGFISKGFIPSEDTNFLSVSTEGAEGLSFEAMVNHQKAVAAVVGADPNVSAFSSSVGGMGGTTNRGNMFVRLKPKSQRRMSADETANALRMKLSRIPGIRALS